MALEVNHITSTMSWLLCLCILCASPIHSNDIGIITDNHQAQGSAESQEKASNGKESQPQVQGQETGEKTQDVVDSDTGKPPGILDTGQTRENEVKDQPDRVRERVPTEEREGRTQTPPAASLVSPEEEEQVFDSNDPVQEKSPEEKDETKQKLEETEEDITEKQDTESEPGGKEISHHPVEVVGGETEDDMVEHQPEETQIAPPSIAVEEVLEDPGQMQMGDVTIEAGDKVGGDENITSEVVSESGEPSEAEKRADEEVGQEEEEKKEDGDEAGVEGDEGEKEEEEGIPETIPPFDEWKAKMLQQAQEEQDRMYGKEKEMPPAVPPRQFNIKDSKNYASSDCGAKILSANKEAQSASHILNFNRDEYMINPCSADIWFIMELCEPIQIKFLEIANLELFSSVPESFRVYTSDRFPAREWRLLGTLFAREERNLQSFPIDEHLFTKYVKIELLTFFGKEHYCPLTVLRVYGTSMVEEIDEEETGGGGEYGIISSCISSYQVVAEYCMISYSFIISFPPTAAVLPPEPTPLAADLKEDGILGHAKNMVMTIVNNAAKAFTGEDKDKASVECQGEGCELVPPDDLDPTPAMSDCQQGGLTTSLPDVEDSSQDSSICPSPCDDMDTEDFKRVCVGAVCIQSDYWNILPNCCLMVLAHTTIHICCGISNCYLMDPTRERDVTEEKKKEPSSEEGDAPPAVTGIPLETVATASSLIISNLSKDKINVLSSPVILPSMGQTTPSVTSAPTLNTEPPVPTVTSSLPSPTVKTPQTDIESEKMVDKVRKTISPTPSVKQDQVVSQSGSILSSSESKDSKTVALTSSDSTSQTKPLSSESVAKELPTSTDSETKLEAKVPPSDVPVKKDIDPTPLAKKEETKLREDVKKVEEKSELEVGKSEKTVSKDEVLEEAVTDELKTVPALPLVEQEVKVEESGPKSETDPTKAAELSQSNGSLGHSGVNSYGSQKDSVFMRLNNRIKSLELNLSLSSKYLEELSKSYKKQMEEMQKSFNKTVKTLTEKVQKAQEKNQKSAEDITRIDNQLQSLDTLVSSLSLKTEDMLQEVVERHLFLMICEVLVFCTLFMLCVRRERNQLRLARDLYERQLEVPQRRNTLGGTNPSIYSPRSRSASAERDGLRAGGSVDDLLIIGPTTPLREAMKANSSNHTRLKPKQKSPSENHTNGSLANPTEFQDQEGKGPKRKGESKSTSKMSHSAGVLFQGSAGSSKSEPSHVGHNCPETIGTVNGTAALKTKKIQNGSKVKR
ncbi:SUN domain-containing ossification factor [Holothuria leucospilota]|uniref:SUN domain-containing ossification factor n=1 Tax=Holothuria leucospilota TaxID=206669 RepID=A0A9Q1C4C9_HOLLE|nr:SUN domain-containing ossification factor [Holothuria leucospilota]